MSENISSNNIYQSQIPSLTDAADIQDAFKLYHFGTTTEPANAGLLTEGIAKHLYDLETLKANIAGPTFTGTLTAPTINASTALQIGGTAITSTAAELNILDGVTSSTAELNILDGVTSSTAELNILDGVTSTAAELNLVDGSSAGVIVNSKALVYGAAGQVNATTLQIAGTNVLAAATPLPGTYGGTGVNNGTKTITLGANFTTSGANNLTLTTTGATNVTLPTTGTLVASGAIVDSDINASAAIVDTKLATISTADKVSLSALNIDGATDIGTALADADLMIVDDGGAGTNRKFAISRIPTYVFTKISGDVTINSSGVASIAANSVALGTDTTGNYVATITASTGISVSGSGSETAAVTITNSGVTSITGTANEITASASTGAVTLSLPSTISADVTGTATQATRAALYVTTGTDTGFDYRRIFVGPTAPENATHTLQIGDVWIDT
jgi:hypothetical protein